MEKYRFTLNGTLLTRNPENWKDIQVTLERQKDIEGLLLIFTSNLTFVEDGYDLLREQFDDNYNNKITANIDILNSNDTYDRLFTGSILLSDIKFNLNKNTAIVSIEDTSFFGAIDNNKNIKTFLNSEFTKNREKVTQPTSFQLDYFTPSTGVFLGLTGRDHYLISDALDFLVRFMTDDEVKGIVSTYLTTSSNFEGGLLYITTGEQIRTGGGNHPNVSFKQLFQFLQRTHNISFVVETNSSGDPVMRIEEKEFFFEQTTSFTIRSIRDLELTVDKQKLFSHLEIGNNTFEKSGNFSSTVRFFSFRDEDYLIEGKSNVDKVLDFKTDFITDNNVIEKIVVTNIGSGDDEFDEDNIIVTGNTEGTLTTKFSSPDFHYNKGLTNDQIILRQINSIPNSVSKYLTAQSTPSRASKTNLTSIIIQEPVPSIIVLQNPVTFDDESSPNYDLGNNFNELSPNHHYEIPFNGVFSFSISADYRVSISTSATLAAPILKFRYRIRIQRFDSPIQNLQETQEVFGPTQTINHIAGDQFTEITGRVTGNFSLSSTTGQKIRVDIAVQVLETQAFVLGTALFQILSTQSSPVGDTAFTCTGADNDAGVYQIFDPADFRALVYKFKKNTNFTDFNTLQSQSLRRIRFNEGSDPALDTLAWIDKIDYKVETSETDYQLIT